MNHNKARDNLAMNLMKHKQLHGLWVGISTDLVIFGNDMDAIYDQVQSIRQDTGNFLVFKIPTVDNTTRNRSPRIRDAKIL